MKNTRNILAASLLCALACTAAQAATITVNDDADAQNQAGICTLRDAVASANGATSVGGCPAGDSTSNTIEFSLPPGITTIAVESGGEIEITENLIINGPVDASGNPLITLDANFSGTNTPGNRIFYVPSTSTGTSLSITGVTFRNGNADSSFGGAIEVDTGNLTLTLEQCAFEGNQAEYGGAVDINSFSSTVIIRNSTFSGNEANDNGGAVKAYTATISNSTFNGNEANNYGGAVNADNAIISNSTFSGNTATEDGGAVWVGGTATISNSTFSGNEAYGSGEGGAAVNAGTAIISNSTFSGNRATNGNSGAVFAYFSLDARHLTLLNNTAGTDGQALYVEDFLGTGTATLHNSIIIGNNNNPQCAGGVAFTGSYNLEGWAASATAALADTTTCGTTVPVPPGATPDAIIDSALADNGGLTQTLALPTGSPAIGAADTTGTSQMWDFTASDWTDATEDQRGVSRHSAADGRDLGAYENPVLPRMMVSPFPLPDGTVGTAYDAHHVTFSGTAGSGSGYTITLADLPLGLSQSGDQLVGTPTAAGNFIIRVTVEDSAGATFTRYLPLTIRALPTGSTPIPVLPVPLLLGLAAALGLLGRKRLTQRA